jgi:hypothetical protein
MVRNLTPRVEPKLRGNILEKILFGNKLEGGARNVNRRRRWTDTMIM